MIFEVAFITLLLSNTSGGCDIVLDFYLKMTSCAWFFGSGLILIFHWKTHLFIFTKSLFCSRADVLLSWITKNKDVPSANSLAFEGNPSNKPLIYIKNNNGPSIEPWGTPALNQASQRFTHLIKLFVLYFSENHIKDLVNNQIYHFLLI